MEGSHPGEDLVAPICGSGRAITTRGIGVRREAGPPALPLGCGPASSTLEPDLVPRTTTERDEDRPRLTSVQPGLGFLAAGYKTADTVAAEVNAVRASTTAPFGVNLFVVEPFEPDAEALDAYRRSLEPEAARLGADLGQLRWDDDQWHAKTELVLDMRPDVVSFTFGCPSPDVLLRLAKNDVLTTVTVTSVAEARAAVARGAASLSVQGPNAGAHRGTWDQTAGLDRTPLLDLLVGVLAAVDVPVVGAGGISDAASVASLLRRGALAAQVGTAYLLADEAGTNPVYRAALTDPAFPMTEVTRAYTGRWARGLALRLIAEHTNAPAVPASAPPHGSAAYSRGGGG